MKDKRAALGRLGRLAGAVGIGIAIVLVPGIAQTHAIIVFSQPEAGAQLSATPGVVTLAFSEPLNARLSRASVIDPAGRRFAGSVPSTGSNARVAAREITVPTPTAARGVYTVAWVTVSTLDGHTMRGSFRFSVGTGVGASAATGLLAGTPAVGTGLRHADLLVVVARVVEDLGLLATVGLVLVGRLAKPRRERGRDPSARGSAPGPEPGPGRAWLVAALGVALAGGICVVGGEALLAAGTPSVGAVSAYLLTGLPGLARQVRLGAEAVALGVAAWRPRSMLVAVPLGGALTGLAAAGHAAAVRPAWLGIGVAAVHLGATGLWAGGVVALIMLHLRSGHHDDAGQDGGGGGEVGALLARFSRVALPAFGLAVASGLVRGVQEVGAIHDLAATPYGQLLAVKGFAVAMMVPLSALAWRWRMLPSRAEAALALLVVAAAATLATYPLPPRRAQAAEQAAAPGAEAAALPHDGDLTLASDIGEVLVGLTVRPALPGRNRLLVELLPTGGTDQALELGPLLLVTDPDGQHTRRVALQGCGPSCRTAVTELRGGERLQVQLPGPPPQGGTAAFTLPALPPPSATSLVVAAQARMHGLVTYRIDETLRPPATPISTRYAFQAPDRMAYQDSTGLAAVTIGTRQYQRDRPGAAWKASDRGPGTSVDVTRFVWDLGPPRAARLLGTATLDGVATRVVSFFAGDADLPIWFRQWIDATGLVRRSEMRAQGHFMDQRYFDLNEHFTVGPHRRDLTPPPSVTPTTLLHCVVVSGTPERAIILVAQRTSGCACMSWCPVRRDRAPRQLRR